METDPNKDGLKNIVESAQAMGYALHSLTWNAPDDIPFLAVPEKVRLESLEAYLHAPVRTKAAPVFSDPEGFIAYLNRHKTPSTHLFARLSNAGATFTAFIEYHDKMSGPVWLDHRASYDAQPTPEWSAWMGSNIGRMNQEGFALFIERQEADFESPNGAELLELVTSLEGKNHVSFDTALRLENGRTALKYTEDVELRGATGSTTGAIEVPREFLLGLAPFEGSVKYRVRARLRYRIDARKLLFWYELVQPHLIVRDALTGLCVAIAEKTGLFPMKGSFA